MQRLATAYTDNFPEADRGFRAFQDWIGVPIPLIRAHGGRESWQDHAGSLNWLGSQFANEGADVVWTVPMLLTTGTDLAAAAAGAYDDNYRAAAQACLNGSPDQDEIIVRFGEEFNGSWMPWRAGNGFGNEANFVATYRRMVDTFRAVSSKFTFEWCVNLDWAYDTAQTYPGDDYVDYIGMDFYVNPDFHPADPLAAWASLRDKQWGVQGIVDFARSRGKQITFPEWGVDNRYAADFSPYINAVFDYFEAMGSDLKYHGYWWSDADTATFIAPESDEGPTFQARMASFLTDSAAPAPDPQPEPDPEPESNPEPEPSPLIEATMIDDLGTARIRSDIDGTALFIHDLEAFDPDIDEWSMRATAAIASGTFSVKRGLNLLPPLDLQPGINALHVRGEGELTAGTFYFDGGPAAEPAPSLILTPRAPLARPTNIGPAMTLDLAGVEADQALYLLLGRTPVGTPMSEISQNAIGLLHADDAVSIGEIVTQSADQTLGRAITLATLVMPVDGTEATVLQRQNRFGTWVETVFAGPADCAFDAYYGAKAPGGGLAFEEAIDLPADTIGVIVMQSGDAQDFDTGSFSGPATLAAIGSTADEHAAGTVYFDAAPDLTQPYVISLDYPENDADVGIAVIVVRVSA